MAGKDACHFCGYPFHLHPGGNFSAGAIDYVVSSWRDGFWIGLFPLLVAMLAIWLMRESKRWQEDQRKVKTSGSSENYLGLAID